MTAAATVSPPPSRATASSSEHIQQLVLAGRRRWQRLLVLEMVGLLLAAPLAYLLPLLLLDSQVHLPAWGLYLSCAGFWVGVAWLLMRVTRRWQQLYLSDDEVALMMERLTPGTDNRLINAVQLGRDLTGPSALTRAVVEENEARLRQAGLGKPGRVKPTLALLGVALVLVAAGVAFWLQQPAQFANAATRVLMPFAGVEPIYRTILVVEPGNVEAVGDVVIHVHIRGEKPAALTILSTTQGRRNAETVPLGADSDEVTYTFRGVTQSMTYSVRGGDFLSPNYRIDVPVPAALSLVRATFHFPEYTGIANKTIEKAGGDLEALEGTTAEVSFLFDQPADGAALLIDRIAPKGPDSRTVAAWFLPGGPVADALLPRPAPAPLAPRRLELSQVGPSEFRGSLTFRDVTGYQIETRQGQRAPHRSGSYALRVLVDQDPKLDLAGIDRQLEVQTDSVLPLQISATDDYGLEKVGLFVRRVTPGENADAWEPVTMWNAERKTTFQRSESLHVANLKVGEGDKVEVALQAIDTDPKKEGRWTTGTAYPLLVGGEGVALQLQYQQIVRTETELKALLAKQQAAQTSANEWVRKLSPDSGMRWDDMHNTDMLHAAMKEQKAAQDKLRERTGEVARAMPTQAGNLRIAVGMLADSEMVRAGRILDSIATRDNPEAKRLALTDARTTQERTARSLAEIIDQFATYRADWEQTHTIPFLRMLADREGRLAEQSQRLAAGPIEARDQAIGKSIAPRQTKVAELCELIRPACTGLAEHLHATQPGLATAFTNAADTLASDTLRGAMNGAATDAAAGHWPTVAKHTTAASHLLNEIHARLRKAQADAAALALAALREKAKSDAEARKELERLNPGNTQQVLRDLPAKLKIEEIVHIQEVAARKGDGNLRSVVNKEPFTDADKALLESGKEGTGQDFGILKLAKTPDTSDPKFPNAADREANTVKPFIHEKFEDLAGNLLDEIEKASEKYQTLTLNFAGMHGDPGEITKTGGRVNSTSADSATGNMKPNLSHSAGVSRPGRQGGRAGGMVVGEEAKNLRGRDAALEGHENVADQEGRLKEQKTNDMQKELSTGSGGKKVESDNSRFSSHDAGRWNDDIAKKMGKPQKVNSIVERQDGKLDPRAAELLRDATSQQEQLIERVKTLKKELRNIYLPTDHLDELERQLAVNLARLSEKPDADLFRLQAQTLDRLHATIKVFRTANAGFQPSLPRERVLRDRVMDGPSGPTLPGYEDVVKRYYEKLASE